ncbi:MAG: monovalent cation/H+ antiporter complex subunit F [Actinomycetota bacterium]|nr:monovalent cation/H+ antiporter complex subunit F [Actinomycetota bacterium]
MSVVSTIAYGGLAVAGLLALARVLRGGTLADRVVGLDTAALAVVAGLAVNAAASGDGIFLDVLVVMALLGFVGTMFVARFIEERGG